MDIYGIVALCGAMFILAATPGPGLFAVVSRALASGFRQASIMTLGLILGDLIYLLMAIYGLSFIAELMGSFFVIVKYIGAIYLLYLGYQIITSKVEQYTIKSQKEFSFKTNFLSGLFITLANPKVIVFYLGFLPAFMNLGTLSNIDVLIITVIVALTLAVVVLTYAYLAARSREVFQSKSAIKKLNITSGGVMMSAGAILLLKN